jgi:hypothetical protein
VGTEFGVSSRVLVWVLNHEVNIEGNGGNLRDSLHHLGAESQGGNKMVVHDVHMDSIRARDPL